MRNRNHTRRVVTNATHLVGRLASASFLKRTLVLVLLTLAVSGIAHAIVQPAHDSSEATADLVDSIVAGEANLDELPPNFVSDMGYIPVPGSGALLNPHGGCSTPGGVGPDRFAEACQVHDLGYDLLRYAEKDGVRLSARARAKLDWKLYVDMLQSCDSTSCSLTATAYYCAVSANSIRQGYKAPHAEPTTPWTALAVAVFGLSAVGGLPAMRREKTRKANSAGS